MSSSKWRPTVVSVLGVLVLVQLFCGCGILGKKEAAERTLAYSSGPKGCLNEFGADVEQYIQGNISADRWQQCLDCVTDSLATFRKSVKPTDAEGYSQTDLQIFISKFLMTRGSVRAELVAVAFELKAALFGGSTSHLSFLEFERLSKLLDGIKRESIGLLPDLKRVNRSHAHDEVLGFMERLKSSADRLSYDLETHDNQRFTAASAETLMQELGIFFQMSPEPGLGRVAMSAKALILAGSDEEIEAWEWQPLVRAVGIYGAAAYLLLRKQEVGTGSLFSNRILFSRLLSELRDAITSSMARAGGAWSMAILDKLIDRAPKSWITIDRAIFKKSLRPLARRILGSKKTDTVDSYAVSVLYRLLDSWSRSDHHIKEIFSQSGLDVSGVSREEFTTAANQYSKRWSTGEQQDVDRLISLVTRFHPLFARDDGQIRFIGVHDYSLHQIQKYHWMNLVAVHLLRAYSPDAKPRAAVPDVLAFCDDYLELMGAFKIIDPKVKNLGEKRFLEADLFTPDSNGDGQLSENELTYFLGFATSIGAHSLRMRQQIIPRCQHIGADPYGTYWISLDCFEDEYFGNRQTYWDHFPETNQFFEATPVTARKAFQVALQRGARRYGESTLPVGRYDIENYAGLLHYGEAVFTRLDTNFDGLIDLNELLVVYPVFKNLIAETGELDPSDDDLVRAAFTYVVRYRRLPIRGFDFARWYLLKPFWKISADRGAIYDVISLFVHPEPL